MWRKRMAVLALLVTVAAVGAEPITAQGNGRGDPIFGNFNGDQFIDRAFLGEVLPDFCSVIVEYGQAGGGFRPPIANVFLRAPILGGPFLPCPDMGVAVDLDPGNTHDEIVVGWFAGPPPTVGFNLLVLRDFQPTFGLFDAIYAQSIIGTADFNGDGRMDVYALSDEDRGFETYLSLGNGTLTRGPEKWCSGPLQLALRDFNGDQAQDALISYIEACSDFSSGVVVVLDDGTPQHLQNDPTGQQTWTAKVVFANSDKIPDVQTVNQVTGQIDYFIGVGNGTFVLSPTARNDTVTITDTTRTAIDILANDYATNQATVTITTPPRSGTAQITSSRTVIYTPRANHGTTDRFVYQLTANGRTSRATVNIRFLG
jgi:hypothetical protein